MSLYDFVAIFTHRKKLIWTVLGGTLLLSLALYRVQPKVYDVSVLLSVTRTASEKTTEYQYDQWYRLQADERMAETLARYFETSEARRSLALVADLLPSERTSFLQKRVKATRLSSQLVEVRLVARTERGGQQLGEAVPALANRYIEELNGFTQDRTWFQVVSPPPLLEDARYTWREMVLAGGAFGVLLAFWMALFDHALAPRARHIQLTDPTKPLP